MKEETVGPLLQVKNLQVRFEAKGLPFKKAKSLQAVKDVSFHLNQGESMGIVGESGCGKSTIARVLCGIQKHNSGKILYNGSEAVFKGDNNLQAKLQMVFQDPFSSLNPRLKVWQQVSEPLLGHNGIKDKIRLREAADSLLQQVGLSKEDGNKYPHQFSGGQRQRIAIARALALEPQILVADEPTASLDVNSQEDIACLLKKFHQEKNLTLLLISHDLTSVRNLTRRVVVLYMGMIMEKGSTDSVLNNPSHPYTKALLQSAPKLDRKRGNSLSVKGDIPSPFEEIIGCPFQSRCSHVMDICRKKCPELKQIQQGHSIACHLK